MLAHPQELRPTKNNIIEAGSFFTLSAGFYVIAPYTVLSIEKYMTASLSGITIILAHSFIAAALIKLYFKLFPLKQEEPNTQDIIKLIEKNPEEFKDILETEFKKQPKTKK